MASKRIHKELQVGEKQSEESGPWGTAPSTPAYHVVSAAQHTDGQNAVLYVMHTDITAAIKADWDGDVESDENVARSRSPNINRRAWIRLWMCSTITMTTTSSSAMMMAVYMH